MAPSSRRPRTSAGSAGTRPGSPSRRAGTDGGVPPLKLGTLVGPARDEALPVLKESFTGYYRWHAKRMLRDVGVARAARIGKVLVGVALLERLTPEVAYVYYIFVGKDHRRQRVGAALLRDALDRFQRQRSRVVYAVVGADNRASIGLFRSQGFRSVARKELSWKDGGLGAWGLRSRMYIIHGERLYGRRLDGQ
ncbi:MAG: GNAT family N-acetyltransferase [Thermoplasmata archaeon]|nr:GNAT family N-acetyltransferase [Thermoplasmata archaeon]